MLNRMNDPRATLPRAVALIEEGMAAKQHVGAQVYVSWYGRPLADFGIGLGRPGVPMTPDTLMIWFSSTKAVTAAAVAQLWQQERVRLDEHVAAYIPEFAQGGKEAITLRHVLTHTGGFRDADGGMGGLRGAFAPWEEVLARICAAPIESGWAPGYRAGYHPTSGWFVLGEIVRRLNGRPFDRYLREEVCEPLGMTDSWVGMPPERYRAYGERIGVMHSTEGADPVPRPFIDTEDACARCVPGGGGRGPMRELGRFYESLLGHGPRILEPHTVEALSARHRVGMRDETFLTVMDWGLGLMVNSDVYGRERPAPYGYGAHASPRAFGHSGSQSSVGFADPEFGLVVAAVFNGTPGELAHQRRIRPFLTALYEDLGLAWS
jgi:CubicO group peptidase (beta-lactamase class C family)